MFKKGDKVECLASKRYTDQKFTVRSCCGPYFRSEEQTGCYLADNFKLVDKLSKETHLTPGMKLKNTFGTYIVTADHQLVALETGLYWDRKQYATLEEIDSSMEVIK